MGRAKSYAERLFEFPDDRPAVAGCTRAAIAIAKAAERPGRRHRRTMRWTASSTRDPRLSLLPAGMGQARLGRRGASPITRAGCRRASPTAIAALDESFFRVRFDRLTPAEKRYLRAMAELGPGPHRSGDIAAELSRKVTSLGPTRSQLISKGMIWSPNHGDTAFTVPLFDEFMRRIMPGDDWRD